VGFACINYLLNRKVSDQILEGYRHPRMGVHDVADLQITTGSLQTERFQGNLSYAGASSRNCEKNQSRREQKCQSHK
jgi:hypothetical protein